jgi:hypothetical protein
LYSRCPSIVSPFLTIPTPSLSRHTHWNDERAKPGKAAIKWRSSCQVYIAYQCRFQPGIREDILGNI